MRYDSSRQISVGYRRRLSGNHFVAVICQRLEMVSQKLLSLILKFCFRLNLILIIR
jgi:hypothetical protein